MRARFRPGILFIGIALVIALSREQPLQTEARRTVDAADLSTPPHLVTRAERLWQMVFPDSRRYRITPDTQEARDGTGAARLHWLVELEDEEGRHGLFRWNSATGELVVMSLIPRYADERRAKVMDDGAAVQLTRRWIRALELDRDDAEWQLAAPPRCTGNRWHTKWNADGRPATAILDGVSGRILAVNKWAF